MTTRVIVQRLLDRRRGLVAAYSTAGELLLTWKGTDEPQAGEYDVELELPDVLEWGREIWVATGTVPEDVPNGAQRLAGELIDFDELGVATLRVGGGIVLADTLGDPPLGVVGEPVELAAPEVHAYPVNY